MFSYEFLEFKKMELEVIFSRQKILKDYINIYLPGVRWEKGKSTAGISFDDLKLPQALKINCFEVKLSSSKIIFQCKCR